MSGFALKLIPFSVLTNHRSQLLPGTHFVVQLNASHTVLHNAPMEAQRHTRTQYLRYTSGGLYPRQCRSLEQIGKTPRLPIIWH